MHRSTKKNTELFTLGHSPDPDDAFMFYAMAENKIDLRGYRFDHRLEDIQTLNERARRGELHISAISIHAYAYVADKYALLPCGASMGDGYGPVVVRKCRSPNARRRTSNASILQVFNPSTADESAREALHDCVIAVPGKLTSAFLALQLFLGEFDFIVVPFDRIFDAIKTGQADAGLIIHEGQLTYADEGLRKIVDLGEWWADRTGGLPLPLGGNVIRRDLGAAAISTLSRLLRDSIAYGLEHREEAVNYAMQFGRGLDRKRTDRFVGMYVNGLTLDYGDRGREAVRRLLDDSRAAGLLPKPVEVEFAS